MNPTRHSRGHAPCARVAEATPGTRRGPRIRHAAALALLALLGAMASAALATAQSRGAAPAPPRAANQPNGGRNGAARPYVPADSGPSAEALRVLETIPEPLGGARRVAAAADSAARDTAARAPADTSAAGAPADSVSAATDADAAPPVPAPTQPLGDTTRTLPSYGGPAGTAPAAPTGPAPGATPASPSGAGTPPATPDTCWAVQVASPSEKARAESLRSAAESLLLVKMMVEPSNKRFGVRTSDCLGGAAADSLRKRALASGFKDAFRVKYVRGKAGK